MAKGPVRPSAPKGRDPAKHSKKDPAKPTRAKAARPDSPQLDPTLAALLNPAIGRGRAGVGSQTGIEHEPRKERDAPSTPSPLVKEGGEGDREAKSQPLTVAPEHASTPAPRFPTPAPERGGEEQAEAPTSKLEPPPDNSFDRRADFSGAHRARASVARGLGEAPQQSYVGKTPAAPGDLDPDLARALGIDEEGPSDGVDASSVITPDMGPARLRQRASRGELGTVAGLASQQSLDRLLREGRPEFRQDDGGAGKIWVPHRPERPEKSEGGRPLVIKSDFEPRGDQPQAIADLVEGARRHDRTQVLLGVTGSGKTFTMAKVIEETQRPALILAPNKTLAAQLYGEFKNFFPDNAVEYFVSYYDYYQPEAYIPRTDTYIEKDSSINEQIDRMRHSATRALLERDDVVIVASVSCIYGIGSVETYSAMTFSLKQGERLDQRALLADLVAHRR